MERTLERRGEGKKWNGSIITKDEKCRFLGDQVTFPKICWDNESSKRIPSEHHNKEWGEFLPFFIPRCSGWIRVEKERIVVWEKTENPIIFLEKKSLWRGSESKS